MTDDALARNLGRGNTGHVPVTLKKFRWRARSQNHSRHLDFPGGGQVPAATSIPKGINKQSGKPPVRVPTLKVWGLISRPHTREGTPAQYRRARVRKIKKRHFSEVK